MGINKSVPGIKNSEQTVLNTSFDEDFGLLAVEGLVYNPTTCTIDRMVQPATSTSQTDGSQVTDLIVLFRQLLNVIANPSYVDKSVNAIRNTPLSGNVTTLGTLTLFGAWPSGQLLFNTSQNTWANMCRSLIT